MSVVNRYTEKMKEMKTRWLRWRAKMSVVNRYTEKMNEMKTRWLWWKMCCEYLSGSADQPPPRFFLSLGSPLWGLWWGLLICLIAMFCGQSSKFIYINF